MQYGKVPPDSAGQQYDPVPGDGRRLAYWLVDRLDSRPSLAAKCGVDAGRGNVDSPPLCQIIRGRVGGGDAGLANLSRWLSIGILCSVDHEQSFARVVKHWRVLAGFVWLVRCYLR